MVPIRIDGPAVEPVSLAEMRAHLRLDGDDEDALLAALIRSARLTVEAAARTVLVETRFVIRLDRWPTAGLVRLGAGPLIAVENVRILDRTGGWADLDTDRYEVDTLADPARLVVTAMAPPPGRRRRGIEIGLTAGHASDAAGVPEPLRQAVRLLAAHWFEHRGDEARPWPDDLHVLVAPYRRPRL